MIRKESAPNLSIIIPIAPQGVDYEIVNKVVNRVGQDVEIILVFDGFENKLPKDYSPDAFKYSEKIRFLQTNARSPGASRNLGLANSKGLWVTFWDSDDSVDLNEFEIALSENLRTRSDILIYNYEVSTKTSMSRIYKTKVLHNASINRVALNPGIWRMIFRKELIQNLEFSSARWGEDQLFFAQVLKSNPIIHFSERAYYMYKVGFSNQLTSRKEFHQDLKVILSDINSIKSSTPIAFCFPLQIMSIRVSLTLIKFGSWKERFVQISRFAQQALRQNRLRYMQALLFVFLRGKISK